MRSSDGLRVRAGQADDHPVALARLTVKGQIRTDHAAAQGHGGHPHSHVTIGPIKLLLGIKTDAVVFDTDAKGASFAAYGQHDPCGLCMLVDIGQRFLEDAKQAHPGHWILDLVEQIDIRLHLNRRVG